MFTPCTDIIYATESWVLRPNNIHKLHPADGNMERAILDATLTDRNQYNKYNRMNEKIKSNGDSRMTKI